MNYERRYLRSCQVSTLEQKEQAKFKHYSEMRKNTFVQIAQNDEIVKQNKKLIEQNDEIISLLKQIANKGEM